MASSSSVHFAESEDNIETTIIDENINIGTTPVTPTFFENSYPPLRRNKQRISFGYKNTVQFASSKIYQNGRRGIWSDFERLAGTISVRLGVRAFALESICDAPAKNPVTSNDQLFVGCEFNGIPMHSFTAIVHVRFPKNRTCRDVLHRWDVDGSKRRTPWLPIGVLNSCLNKRSELDPLDVEDHVVMSLEVTIYMEKVAETCLTKYYAPFRLLISNELIQSKATFHFVRGDTKIEVDRTLVEAESEFFKAYFSSKSVYVVTKDQHESLKIILRYIQFKLVPRSDQMTTTLLTAIVTLQMHELQRICLQILHPIRVRMIRLGYIRIFEMLSLSPDVYEQSMFDLLLPNGNCQKPLSMSALTMSCLSVGSSGVKARMSKSDLLRSIKYAIVHSPPLLGPNLLSVILRTDDPPRQPSTPDTSHLTVYPPSQFSTDGSSKSFEITSDSDQLEESDDRSSVNYSPFAPTPSDPESDTNPAAKPQKFGGRSLVKKTGSSSTLTVDLPVRRLSGVGAVNAKRKIVPKYSGASMDADDEGNT